MHRLIEAKISGRARNYIEPEHIRTLDELFSELRKSYAPLLNLGQPQVEVAMLKQSGSPTSRRRLVEDNISELRPRIAKLILVY